MKRMVTIAAAGVMVAGACGGGQSAKASLVDAIDALADAPGLTYTVTLRSDVESLQALAEDTGGDLSASTADTILGSSVVLSAMNETEPTAARATYAVNIGENDGVLEVRVIGTDLYARADVPTLLETFGQDPAAAGAFAAQAEAAGVSFARAAVQGRWLALKDFDELARQITGGAITGDAPSQAKALEALSDDLEANATVAEGDEEGPGDHLVATIGTRDAYRAFLDLAKTTAQQLPAQVFPPASEVPDEDIEIDAWVEDGVLTQIAFDLLQPAVERLADDELPSGAEEFAIVIGVEEFTGDIEVPGGAVEIDLQDLFGAMSQATVRDSASATSTATQPGPGDFCKELKDAPPEVQKRFEDECPQLQKG